MKEEAIEQKSTLSDNIENNNAASQNNSNYLEQPLSEKEEILREIKEIKTKQSKKRLHWGSVLVTTILILLIIFSGIQVVQSANILVKVKGNDFKSSSTGGTSQGTSGTQQTPSSVQNLPNMVGGC